PLSPQTALLARFDGHPCLLRRRGQAAPLHSQMAYILAICGMLICDKNLLRFVELYSMSC
ncbi:MAG TPA: hypothetical protein VGM01_00970, partial [Ktedonobacteraceae bacterium]